MAFRRYAVYHTPIQGALARFGAGWLGWDIARGRAVDLPAGEDDLPAPPAELTETPRRYGFHATIKPPFRLAEGQTQEGLTRALGRLCEQMPPVTLDGLELAPMGRFLALVARGETAQLTGLAALVVETLDSFRAPPEAAELARRRAAGLSPRQEALLARWGYPWVMEEFRFHMTLTGKLPRAWLGPVHSALAARLKGVVPTPYLVDGLSLVGEAEDGRFHLVRHYPLSI